MRALVTGGAGFIGSHLVDALLARGDRVAVLDDLSTGSADNLSGALAAGATLAEASVTDPEAVAASFADHSPEIVFHLAAQMDVRVSIERPVFDLDVNVGGTINLLEEARKDPQTRIVFASTGGAIYGEGAGRELPVAESSQRRPDAPYGQSKLSAEGYLSLYSRLYGVEATSLRLGNVYGPRQDPHGEAGVVAIFCGALLGGTRPRVFGDGGQTRDYIYVDDVVAAFLAAAAAPAGGPYNIGTGVETSVLELGGLIAAACGTDFEPEFAPARTGEVERIAIDPSRAASELGWRAECALADGLAATVESFRGGRAQRSRS
ncbi:MAG TPA: NAD-dependent epimerase/dehydratase family protein [Solirubrobacterales bacterium]|nr:NAD-dependent epimerase/dehydratase family protein [Solirubrobacterales bacterium]